MTPPVALVVGASGQVGRNVAAALAARGHAVVGTGFGRAGGPLRALDLRDEEAIRAAVRTVSPSLCVLSSALTNVDRCEEEPALAEAMNSRAPEVAAAACRGIGAKVVYLSTEYVFDGAAGPYGEDDPTCPISVYGRTKLEGEQAVLAADPDNLSVRTTVVFSFHAGDKNFAMQLIERLGRGERMRVPADQVSSPTWAPWLGEAIATVAGTARGVLNVAGPEVLDRLAFARRVAAASGLDAALLDPIATAELGQKARRPLRAGLRIDRLRALGVTPPTLDAALTALATARRAQAGARSP
jgi:dTDP-4-dehydrorhamnose reductase